jgi:hypothetical protein
MPHFTTEYSANLDAHRYDRNRRGRAQGRGGSAPAPRSWFEQGLPFTRQKVREAQFVADVTGQIEN